MKKAGKKIKNDAGLEGCKNNAGGHRLERSHAKKWKDVEKK